MSGGIKEPERHCSIGTRAKAAGPNRPAFLALQAANVARSFVPAFLEHGPSGEAAGGREVSNAPRQRVRETF